jgi:hypothetical protein
MTDNNEALLRAILRMVARQAFSATDLSDIVGSGEKQRRAYNMCDGTKTQGQIAKAIKLNDGNFSKTVSRWVDAGVLFRLGEGRETKLLHAYPLPKKVKGAS